MAIYADTVSTWDRDVADGGPCRPSLAQVGGAQQTNGTPAPDPTMPTAEALNQHEYQHAAVGGVVPLLEVSVHYTTGTPSVVAFASVSSVLVLGDLSLVTDGTGDCSVFWPPALLPTPNVYPTAAINFDASGAPPTPMPAAPVCGLTSDVGPPALTGARVVMTDRTGTLADYDFTVTVR